MSLRSMGSLRLTLAAAGLLLTGTLTIAAPASASKSPMSVGSFVLMYARAAHIAMPAEATPAMALAAIQATGALNGLDLNLDRALTHADVVKIGHAAGVKVTSATPTQTIDKSEAELFLQAFHGTLFATVQPSEDRIAASDNPPGDPAHNARTDKGKKKGRPFTSPSEPD